ncbi:MAG: hypothetical protein L3K02_02050 [Thermoplasmata archaeon]|nr:hypothetical protein [Thermoplasmata archaeon]
MNAARAAIGSPYLHAANPKGDVAGAGVPGDSSGDLPVENSAAEAVPNRMADLPAEVSAGARAEMTATETTGLADGRVASESSQPVGGRRGTRSAAGERRPFEKAALRKGAWVRRLGLSKVAGE